MLHLVRNPMTDVECIAVRRGPDVVLIVADRAISAVTASAITQTLNALLEEETPTWR